MHFENLMKERKLIDKLALLRFAINIFIVNCDLMMPQI